MTTDLMYTVWKNFQSGSKEAFATIYNLYLDSLYQYGVKLCPDKELVKDAIQEIFLDLYLKHEKINTEPEKLKYYLLSALKHNLIKKIQREKIFSDEEFESLFLPEYNIEEAIIDNEEAREIKYRVGTALKKLPSKQKEALYLRYNELIAYPEIAKIMDISIESARKQVYRAIKTLRELLS